MINKLTLFTLIMLSNIFINNVQAQTFEPPMYCMGMGTDCSTAPAPSLPPVRNKADLPCTKDHDKANKGFLLNFLEVFLSFFNPEYKSHQGSCSENTAPPASNTVNPAESKTAASGIQFVDHTVAQVGGEDMFITVSKPLNIQPGDVLVAMIGSDYAHVSTSPLGWVTVRQDVKNSGHADDLAMQSYYKIATAQEEGSYTWSLVTARKDTPSSHQPLIAVDLYAFRGVDSNNPIFSNDSHGETTDPTEIECPEVEGVAGGVLLCSYIGDDPGPIIAPSSMTQTSNFEISEADSYAIAYETLTSSGNTGPRIAQWDNPGRNSNGSLKSGSDYAHAIVLRPMK